MIVAITGATGFIGRHLAAKHIACGDDVRCISRSARKKDGANWFVGDLTGPVSDLQHFLDGADVVYHCAAELRNPQKMHAVNVNGTANLLLAARGRVGRWVQLSSTGVYGIKMHNIISETSPLNPCNLYEKTKVDADHLVKKESELSGLKTIFLHPSNVYGIDMPNQSLIQLIRAIIGGKFFFIGKTGAIANYIHVDNVVNALQLCAQTELAFNARSYIVSDHLSLESLVELVVEITACPKPSLRLPESALRLLCSALSIIPNFPLTPSRIDALTNRYFYMTQRIEDELGYKHITSAQSGLTELIRYAHSQ